MHDMGFSCKIEQDRVGATPLETRAPCVELDATIDATELMMRAT
jgi:hypothetical protein